ncbi:MAG TPA: TonB-dependent receptor [Sphingomonadaceae bacterium]|nr:TonB-dependent receptor [Sphingomonadaceae bacterium]
MRRYALFALAASIASPVQAKGVSVDAPAGRGADVAVAIARQTGTSIVLADPALSNRRVSAIKGSYSPSGAVKKLARALGAKAIPAGQSGWRLVADATPRRAAARPSSGRSGASRKAAPPPHAVSTEDIVVIGSKRDIELALYPGAVEMIEGKDLTFGGAGGTEKIIQRAPTVSSTHLGSGRNKLFIRGIADSSFTGPTQATVGQYFGDLRLSYNAPDPDLRLSDLERVEILEGPQGTLYGAGALGGILRMVPNAPEPGVTTGTAMVGGSATQHGAMGGDASATINLPVGKTGALRVTLDAETRGGYIDKPLLDRKDVNRTDVFGGRAALRFEVGDDWTIDLLGIGQTTNGHDSQYADRDGPSLTRAAQVDEGFDADFAQGQIVIAREFGDIRFKSSTGLTGQTLEERYDATALDGDPRLFVQRNETNMLANETRIWKPMTDRFSWVLGMSFTRNHTTLSRALGDPGNLAPTTGVRNSVDEFTVYGEGSYKLTDNLVATAGGRYTHSWLSGEGEDIALASLTQEKALILAAATSARKEGAFLPSASLVATVLPETTVFLRYQEGFRPGGVAIASDLVNRFKNDHISTIEFGARHGNPKRAPFDLSASISFTRWTDIQADYIDSSGFPTTANIGDGRIWSASLKGSVEVTPGLRFDAGLTFNDSRVYNPSSLLDFTFGSLPVSSNVSGPPLQDVTVGRTSQVPNIARLSGRVGFAYDREIDEDLLLTAQGWVNYVGKSRLGVGPELGEEQGNYIDSGLTVRIGNDAMGLTLGLTNLTDEEGNRFALGTPFAIGRDQITPLRPRTIRLGLDAAF